MDEAYPLSVREDPSATSGVREQRHWCPPGAGVDATWLPLIGFKVRRKGALGMQFDLGIQGLGILIGLSVVFGVIAQLVLARASTRWIGLIGAVGYFIGGLFVSEVMFATATEAELQPQIDGLSFDEALLGGLLVGVAVVLATWYVARRSRLHPPISS